MQRELLVLIHSQELCHGHFFRTEEQKWIVEVLFSVQFSQHLSHSSRGIFTRVFFVFWWILRKPNALCESSSASEYEQLLWQTILPWSTGDWGEASLKFTQNSLGEEPKFSSRPEIGGPSTPLLAIMFMHCVLMTTMQCYTPPGKREWNVLLCAECIWKIRIFLSHLKHDKSGCFDKEFKRQWK